jgi:Helix-turn-helix of DDE superfamily endonuclease
MQKYEVANRLSSNEFVRLTGIQKITFMEMVTVIKEIDDKRPSRRGKPFRLSIEDRLLMTLEYLREYRTYFHLGQSYGISESACYRNCRWIEDALIKSKKFSLPGKKALLKSNAEFEVILIDATESPIERPKKKDSAQKADKEQKQQTKKILLWKEETTHLKEPGCRGQEIEFDNLYKFL